MLIKKTDQEKELIKARAKEISQTLYQDNGAMIIEPLVERIAELELYLEGHLSNTLGIKLNG